MSSAYDYDDGVGDANDVNVEMAEVKGYYDDDDEYKPTERVQIGGVLYDAPHPTYGDGDFFNAYCDRAEINDVDPPVEQMLPPDWRPRYKAGNRPYSAGDTRFVFQLGPENMAVLEYYFDYHTGGQDVCDREQLAHILRSMGLNPTYDDIQAYADGYSRSVAVPTFTLANVCDIIRSRLQDTDEKILIHELTDCLRIFDDTREGYIPKDLLQKNMMKIPPPLTINNPAGMIDELIRTMDDGNSLVSYERFVTDLVQYSKKYIKYCEKKIAQQARPITTDPKVVLEVLNDQRRYHQHMAAWSLMKDNMNKVKTTRAKRNLKKQQKKEAERKQAAKNEELERQRREEEARRKIGQEFDDD